MEVNDDLPDVFIHDENILWSFPPVTVHMVLEDGERQVSTYMDAFTAVAVLQSGEYQGLRLTSAIINWHCVNARDWDTSI